MPTRQVMERRIIRRLATDAIAAGYRITVDNGGDEMELTSSTDVDAVIAATQLCDEELLILRKSWPNGQSVCGWVKLVYGNDGYDVICDYTTDLEPILAGANALADKLEAEDC